MAKLTLAFKDRKLKIFALRGEDCLIGRDADCTIAIDSLAVETRHARITPQGDSFVLEAVSPDCPISVNNSPLKDSYTLQDGDDIVIGKHSLKFSLESEGTVIADTIAKAPVIGWLQIQNGEHLGRTIRLDQAITRVGKPESDLAVVAHRDDGYYVSRLQGEQGLQVNRQDIGGDSCRLNNGDQLAVGDLHLQFFADGEAVQASAVPSAERDSDHQRRFSRIPFDVSATLSDASQSWETSLLDISLHGALIKTPENFEADSAHTYLLAVHLEGGPDICMDVAIAHQEKDELGLDCKDIDVDSITHLRRLVELNLGDPQLLERELSALG